MGLFSQLKDKFFPGQSSLDPESNWTVTVTDTSINTTEPKNGSHSLLISELEDVLIATNDSGPIGIDLWWILRGNGKVILVPGGATGEKEMLNTLQKLSGFNNTEVIRAMGSTDNAEFLLWKKS
ncbi:MAG: hypothetical protein H0U95_10380 [Bacteroidetes bacterium]|nr:hypothetical protein [Bacteroidota bacterium]